MPNPNVSIFYSNQLCGLSVAREQIPEPMPLNVSPWVAMSLLQKAIRRGDAPAALSGAATLLMDAPERLWRRIGCIAFEDMPVQRRAGEAPSYALDTYTREGKQTFARFLKTNAGTVDWIEANFPAKGRSAFLGELVFRVEGGCLANRRAGKTADQLREQFELGCLGVSVDQAKHVLTLMRKDMYILDRIRADVMGEQK